jgi:metal-dependent amidase/aminoacylase/carboxypeptidase family protein
MLGVAKFMVALKNEWKGALVFVAAEEVLIGAQAIVNDSMYTAKVLFTFTLY